MGHFHGPWGGESLETGLADDVGNLAYPGHICKAAHSMWYQKHGKGI